MQCRTPALAIGGPFRYSVMEIRTTMNLTFRDVFILIVLWWVCAALYNTYDWKLNYDFNMAMMSPETEEQP